MNQQSISSKEQKITIELFGDLISLEKVLLCIKKLTGVFNFKFKVVRRM